MSDNSTSSPWILHVHCRETHRKKLMSALGLVLFLLVLFLNGIVLVTLLRKLRKLSVGNVVLLHLSAAECFLSLTVVPNNVVLLVGNPVATFLCEFVAFSARLTHTATMYLITILTTVRCYGALKPFKYRANIFPSRIHKICAAVWCWALVIALMPFFGLGKYESSNGRCYCFLDTNKYPYSWSVYCIINYILPIMINTVAFASTAKTLKGKFEFKTSNSTQNQAVSFQKSRSPQLLRSKRIKAVDNDGYEVKDACAIELTNERIISPNPSSKFVQESTVDNTLTVEVDIEIDPIEKMTQRNYFKQNQPKRVVFIQPISEPHLQSIDNGENSKVENAQNQTSNNKKIFASSSSSNLSCPIVISQSASPHCPTYNVPTSENIIKETGKIKEEHKTHSPNIVKRKIYELNEIQARDDIENSSPEELCPICSVQLSSQQSHAQCINKSRNEKTSKKDQQLLKVALFFVCYVLFYIPTPVVRSWYAVMPEDVPEIAFEVSQILPVVNSLINPFLYGYLSEEIRHDVKHLFLYLFGKCRLTDISSN